MFKNLPTLKSLPSAIGLPFLSSQEDAQLKFKSDPNGIRRLAGEEIIPLSDVVYWAQYYSLFSSASEVHSLITVADVRAALRSNPTNLASLLLHLSHHLFTLLPSPLFPSRPVSSSPFASPSLPLPTSGSSSSSSSGSTSQDPTKEALNCLRVLGRVVVVVYEAEAEARERRASLGLSAGERGEGQEETFAEKYLWSRAQVDPLNPEAAAAARPNGQDRMGADEDEGEAQFRIEDSDSEDEDEVEGEGGGKAAFHDAVGHPPSPTPDPSAPGQSATEEDGPVRDPLSVNGNDGTNANGKLDSGTEEEEPLAPCLIDRLFSCTIDLLFCAGFTVPESVRGGKDSVAEKINYVIWERGVGSTVSIGSTAELDRNKTEVLRFLLILLSYPIYTPPHLLSPSHTPNLPLALLTHSLERRLVLSLLCSWLNTSLSSLRSGSSGKSSLLGSVPYQHLLTKSAEERAQLVRGCLMLLLVVLDPGQGTSPPGPRGAGEMVGAGEMGEPREGKEDNAFRYFVSKLHRKEDFQFILSGILGILEEQFLVKQTYLPGSKRPVAYILETFMLFWRMVDLNKRFRAFIYASGAGNDVIGYILLTCLELKDDPAHHGLLRMLSYLLQTLSADTAFAEGINSPLTLAVPAKWAVPGSAADFLIVSIYSIATTPGLNPLFPALTISITNIAPSLRSLGVQASTRLLQLFKAFSAPSFLLADEGHPRLVYYLLETFNAVLYHGLRENPNLVYAILRSHADFQTMATFTLTSGLRDIQRKQALRAAAMEAKKDAGLRRGESATDINSLAEKTALLGSDVDAEDAEANGRVEKDSAPTSPPTVTIALPTPGLSDTSDPLANSLARAPSSSPTLARSTTTPLSEKARGKQRATSPLSSPPLESPDLSLSAVAPEIDLIPDDELLRLASSGVGPNGYVPTQEWVASWQKGLPLDPVLVAISELLPLIQEKTPRAGAPSQKVFRVLKEAELGGVLPPQQPSVPRKFHWSSASQTWLTSLLWGDIYVAGITSVGIWKDTHVRLFGVKQQPQREARGVGKVLRYMGVPV